MYCWTSFPPTPAAPRAESSVSPDPPSLAQPDVLRSTDPSPQQQEPHFPVGSLAAGGNRPSSYHQLRQHHSYYIPLGGLLLLHSFHTQLVDLRGIPSCPLLGLYFPMMGFVVVFPVLLLGCLWIAMLLHPTSFPPLPWSLPVKHPVVFFPGYSTSRLRVTIENQTFNSNCPPSGRFEFVSGHILPWEFKESCVMEALKILYDPTKSELKDRFSSQPGVTVEVADFGAPGCAPIYLPLYFRLFAAGYISERSLFVACYDFRMAPNVDVTPGHAFIQKAKEIIETAFRKDRRKVYLMAHSNGGPMALLLLKSQTPEWKAQHIAGLISFAGNWAGQGNFVSYLFTALSFADFLTPFPEAAFTLSTWPAVYYSMSQPSVYGKNEVVVQANGKNYTPANYQELFDDAKLDVAKQLFPLFNGLSDPSEPPGVDVYSFYGSGLKTEVGVVLPELKQGVLPDGHLYLEGDGDQEAIDNEANFGWSSMASHKFEAIERPGVSHLFLPFSGPTLTRTIQIIQGRSDGPSKSGTDMAVKSRQALSDEGNEDMGGSKYRVIRHLFLDERLTKKSRKLGWYR